MPDISIGCTVLIKILAGLVSDMIPESEMDIFPSGGDQPFIGNFLKTMCLWNITAFRMPRIWAWNFIRMRCPKEFWSFLTKLCDRSGFTAAVFPLL